MFSLNHADFLPKRSRALLSLENSKYRSSKESSAYGADGVTTNAESRLPSQGERKSDSIRGISDSSVHPALPMELEEHLIGAAERLDKCCHY
jgi:hypothetical protein